MKLGWRGALGIALSVLFLVWTLHDIRLASVAHELARANVLLFVLSATASTLIFPLRAARWQVILEPVAGRIAFGPLWRATAIGMMVNDVAPARAGEPARAYALARETKRVSFAAAFASLAVDRLFDGVVLLLLLAAAMLSPAFPSNTKVAGHAIGSLVLGGSIGALVLTLVLYAMVFFPTRLVAMYEAFAGRVSPRLAERGRVVLLAFTDGLGVLRTPSRFGSVFAWTVAHWVLNAFGFWLGFRAVGIRAPFSAALFLQTIIGIGVAVPSAPGFFGVFEGFARAGLAVYGVDETLAVSWAIGYHILSFIPIVLIGLYYFVRLGLHFDELGGERPSDAR